MITSTLQIVPCPSSIKDYSGFKNGRVVVLGFSRRTKTITYWVGKCGCGFVWEIRGGNLSRTNQCRKCQAAKTSFTNIRHGLSSTRIYGYWLRLKKQVGSRLAPEWEDVAQFVKDVSIPKGFTLVIPNEGLVNKDTLRIVPRQYKSRQITCHGQTHNLRDWGSILGLSGERIRQKVDQAEREGIPLEEILVSAFTQVECNNMHAAESYQRMKKLREHYIHLLDGKVHPIVADDPYTFIHQLQGVAKAMGKKIATRKLGGHLLIQAK